MNHIDAALEKYNNRVHTTTRMTPADTSNDEPLPNVIPRNTKLPKFQVGDFVGVPDKKNIYTKSYITNWNRELFKICRINNTNPVTYGLKDQDGEQIGGKYYEQELLRSVFNFDSEGVRKYEFFPSK